MQVTPSVSSKMKILRCVFAAFTVTEVLVAVTIITILVSLLYPSFRRAQLKAKEPACAVNLRQIGSAFSLLLNDRDGYFPRYQNEKKKLWYSKLLPYLEESDTIPFSRTKPLVFKCPSNLSHEWNYDKLSYGYNQFLGDNDPDGSLRIQVRYSHCVEPSKSVKSIDV